MKPNPIRPSVFVRFLFCWWLGVISAHAASGEADPLFAPELTDNGVELVAVQRDGRIIAGGSTSPTGGIPSGGLTRMYSDGKLDSSFNPVASLYRKGISAIVLSGIRIQDNDDVLVHGYFYKRDGFGSISMRRFHPDGSLDDSFNPPEGVIFRELLPDGKILAERQTLAGNVVTSRLIVRLNQDGSPDPGFVALGVNGPVADVDVQDDGKILICGGFTDVAGTTQDYLIRLEVDGPLDSTFNAHATNSVSAVVARPDGKILSANVFAGSSGLVRLMPDGAIDPTFTLNSTGFSGFALQADGAIILTGASEVHGTYVRPIQRVISTGGLDYTFTNPTGGAITMQPDGKLLVGKNYGTPSLMRLENTAAQSTFVNNGATLQWLRGGTAPEIGHVVFEKYDPSANSWVRVAAATRIAGGWSVPTALLPVNGVVRVRGVARGWTAGTTRVEAMLPLGNVTPSIRIDSPVGTQLSNGATVDCGGVLGGYTGVRRFSITNAGAGVLSPPALTISGMDAAQFKVVEFAPDELGPQSDRTFGIWFSPIGTGPRSAVLTIGSNDPGGVFTVNLAGAGTTDFSPFVNSADEVPLTALSFDTVGKSFGTLGLGFAPAPGTILTAINVTGRDPISGRFSDLPDGARVSATYGGQTYVFVAGYQGGLPANTEGNNLTLTLTGAGVPRREFMPQIPDYRSGIAVASDGTMVVYDISGYRVMLKPDGSPVTGFKPVFSLNGNSVSASRVVSDRNGKFLVAGRFDQVNGVNRPSLARFDSQGKLDMSFTTGLTGNKVYALAVQGDGKVLISGGGADETDVFRLNADGSSDPGFSVNADGYIQQILPLANGKIMVAGSFTVIDGVPCRELARLNPNGSLDPTFTFNPDVPAVHVGAMAEQIDGKLLISFGRLRRLNPDGGFDSSFIADVTALALAIQADGKILVGGRFDDVNGRYRSGLVRLHPDGTTDTTFGGTCFQANFLALLGDGEIIINGGIVAGTVHTGLARLTNDPAQVALEIPDAATVRLLTGGSAPLLRSVTFDVLPTGATDWVPLPAPVRVANGWTLSGQTLPVAGIIRSRAMPVSSGSASVVIEKYLNFGESAPDIVVSGPEGDVMADNANSVDFGPVLAGQNRNLKVRVTNQGDGVWDGISTTISGAGPADFMVIDSPKQAVLPGETGIFEIRFSPLAAGTHQALLTIASNDPAHSPFRIPLTGSGGDVLSPTFHEAEEVIVTAESFAAAGKRFGTFRLAYAPPAGTVLTVVSNTGTGAISGRFDDLPDGAAVSANFGGNTYKFVAGYAGGDGNDLVLIPLGPGILDPAIRMNPSWGNILVTVPIENGGTLLGGEFTSMNGIPRNRLAIFRKSGGLDLSWDLELGGSSFPAVAGVHRFPDGKTLIVNSTSSPGDLRDRIIRLMPDGSVDPFFQVSLDGSVRTVSIQPDGKIVFGGSFQKVNGITRNRLARLNPDGTLDTGFNPNVTGNSVDVSAVQPDGKIIIAGVFVRVGTATRASFARIESDGTPDLSFNPTFLGGVGTFHVQSDGRILIGGDFSKVNGVTRNRIARLTSTGELDGTFNPSVTGSSVLAIVPQADGKLLIGGNINAVGGAARNQLARLNPDGSLDESLNPDIRNGSVRHIALHPDGKIDVAGSFTRVNGVACPGFARLLNHETVSTLEKEGSTVIRWLRGGTFPTDSQVVFDIHEAGGSGWRVLGNALPVTGGWELGGLSLPPSAVIRARSKVTIANASYPQTVLLQAYGNAVPILAVSDSAGSSLGSSSSLVDLGSVPTSFASETTLRISNLGLAGLENIAVSLDGPAAGDFSVTGIPAVSLAPTETSTIRIRFTPSAAGLREADLRIASGAAGGEPLVVKLAGTGGSVFSPVFGGVNDKPVSGTSLDFTGQSFGSLILKFAPPVGVSLVAAANSGTTPVKPLMGLPDQSLVTADFGGVSYRFAATYRGGDGNDLAFVRLGGGAVDPEFVPDPALSVIAFGLQPDGRAIITGRVTQASGSQDFGILRLLPDGSVDPTFKRLSSFSRVEGITILRDGRTLVCSTVVGSDGLTPTYLVRLNADGSFDSAFSVKVLGAVYRALELKSGKILIGGQFSTVGGVARHDIALLNSDGTLDTGFTSTVSGTGAQLVNALAEQADGKLIVGGTFNLNGRTYLARLGSTGVLDPTFNAALAGSSSGTSVGVTSLALQKDGGILVAGYFTSVGGVLRNGLVRLTPDGSLDSGFLASADNATHSMLVQVDGKIVISGDFSRINGVARAGIARLNVNGSLDESFDPHPLLAGTPVIYGMAMQANGTLLIGGDFSSMNGIGSGRFARLLAEPVTSGIEMPDDSTVVWNRSGTLADLRETFFEVSGNGGATWTLLGSGTRTATGWQIGGLNLPVHGIVRARGDEMLAGRSSAVVSGIRLFGRDATALEQWRERHFGMMTNEGWASNSGDTDMDGWGNLVEFAFGRDPKKSGEGVLPGWVLANGGYEVGFSKPDGVEGVTFGAEWSDTMREGDWHPVENTGSGSWLKFRVPLGDAPNRFVRLKVTEP